MVFTRVFPPVINAKSGQSIGIIEAELASLLDVISFYHLSSCIYMDSSKKAYLPRVAQKFEVATYFGLDTRQLRNRVVTRDLIEEWGFDYESFKRDKSFPVEVTKKIYQHFKIRDLNMTLSEELYPDSDEAGHRASDY